MREFEYEAKKIGYDFDVDGDVDKSPWNGVEWSRRFVDLVTGDPGLFDTRTAVLWSDSRLYVAFKAEEPFLEARLTERDSIIFQESDLELFIDGGDCYYELEVNAANTIYEVFFIWRDAYEKGGRFDIPVFDVHERQAYTFGGDYDRRAESFWEGTNPRGIRWAFTDFDMPGLKTAVRLDGTLNDNSDLDEGWSLEISIPWSSLDIIAGDRNLPPNGGDVWRMFLGRFQKLVQNGMEVQPHPATALSSHGVYDVHFPEKWSRVLFVD